MEEFKNIDDILNYAINAEQNAADFYTDLAKTARSKEMKETFAQYAKEELGHKARISSIKTSGKFDVPDNKVTDLKIGDYLVDVQPHPDMDYQEVLILAMKREKNAFKLYTHLSQRAPNAEIKKLFHSLAQDEAKHKLRFEIEYDEFILKEN